jgi:prevent-host-death family protein
MAKRSERRIPKKIVEEGVIISPPSAYAEMSLSRLRSKLGDVLNRVQYGRECIMVTNYGKQVAQILPVPKE